jgi:ABC-2 type transport system permease protein
MPGARSLYRSNRPGTWRALSAFTSSLGFVIFALISLGLLASTKAKSQNEALQVTLAIMLPSIFFSGFIFPRETMPWIFYALGAVLPAPYFIELMRAIILRGAGFLEFWRNLLVLAVMGAVLFSMCALRFKRKIG